MESQLASNQCESKGPGEKEGMLQAPLGPHPISILGSELHHPASLAPNSQLPLWSISRWRLHCAAFFYGHILTNGGDVQKK